MPDEFERRCRTCARFVRVIETIDAAGEVRRAGDCLLGVWPSPLYETNTCSQWTQRGQFKARPPERAAGLPRSRRHVPGSAGALSTPGGGGRPSGPTTGPRPTAPLPGRLPGASFGATARRSGSPGSSIGARAPKSLPEDLLDMDADEFRRVLCEVLRDELGVGDVEIAGKWQGGEMILKPGKEGLQEKRVPLEALFRKIVTIRDKLRVLEQRINTHPKLGDDDKLQLQQYVTGCYGSLTTFNVLFAARDDQFVGQKGEE